MPGQDDTGLMTSFWPSWRTSDYADSQCVSGAASDSLEYQVGMIRKSACWRLCRWRHKRHRFATNTLVTWYRSNQDPECLLPILSAYLGHVHVADTQWYLEGSPELMREAMRRLEQHWEGRP